MALATEMLTVNLPTQAVKRLRRVAEIAQRPIDEVVAETLQSTLPPVLEDLPIQFQADLAQMEGWSNDLLRKEMLAQLDDETLRRFDKLLEKNQTQPLKKSKVRQLSELRTQADRLMYRKAYAALLLKWRGERIPSLTELETERSPL